MDEETREKINIMKEDYFNEWWKASAIDDYDLNKKLKRVGCRPILRRYNKCILENENNSGFNNKCNKLKDEKDRCYEVLYSLYSIEKFVGK